jgi:hypothetical protein
MKPTLVSSNPGVQFLVERLADRLDLNRRLSRPQPPRRRSREEAVSEAASRWAFRYHDPVDDEAPW